MKAKSNFLTSAAVILFLLAFAFSLNVITLSYAQAKFFSGGSLEEIYRP